MEAALVLVVAVLLGSSALVASDFCVCRSEQPTAVLQKAIDYACGQGADCTAIAQSGACYSPDEVAAHCSWAANSYFQKFRSTGATCDFSGAATLSTTDPSTSSSPSPLRPRQSHCHSTSIYGFFLTYVRVLLFFFQVSLVARSHPVPVPPAPPREPGQPRRAPAPPRAPGRPRGAPSAPGWAPASTAPGSARQPGAWTAPPRRPACFRRSDWRPPSPSSSSPTWRCHELCLPVRLFSWQNTLAVSFSGLLAWPARSKLRVWICLMESIDLEELIAVIVP
uniref:X8 domain-containing protein n=1 Tax=Aegilops tauschii subsp. strangulata TaxID=200361 RepID=A0A453N9P9_AEGTS